MNNLWIKVVHTVIHIILILYKTPSPFGKRLENIMTARVPISGLKHLIITAIGVILETVYMAPLQFP
jgi:hypothetical protein